MLSPPMPPRPPHLTKTITSPSNRSSLEMSETNKQRKVQMSRDMQSENSPVQSPTKRSRPNPSVLTDTNSSDERMGVAVSESAAAAKEDEDAAVAVAKAATATATANSENPDLDRKPAASTNPDSSAQPAAEELTGWRMATVTLAAAEKRAAETAAAKALKAVQKAKEVVEDEEADEAAKADAEENRQVKESDHEKAVEKVKEAKTTLENVYSAVNSLKTSENPDRDQIDKDLFLALCNILGVTDESLQEYLRIPEVNHPRRKQKIEEWIETLDSIDDAQAEFRDFYKKDWRNALIQAKRYFHTIDNVIRVQYKKRDSIPKNYANCFKRSKVPGVEEYEKMNDASALDLVTETSRSQSHNNDAKYRFWKCDILGRKEAQLSELAHLIPGSRNHANEWYDVACWAFAIDPFQNEWASGLRVLHGVIEGGIRKSGSGLRHFRANKLRIQGQAKLLDKNNPKVLIIPIMEVERCKEWKGEGYNAIVLAKDGATFGDLGAADSPSKMRSVSYDTTPGEVQMAIELLHDCTLALAKSTMTKFAKPPKGSIKEKEKKMTKEAIKDRENAKTRFELKSDIIGNTDIPVPVLQDGTLDLKYRGICKISFCDWGVEDDTKNPAPDPLVLVARASVVWSVMKNMRLRASAEPHPDDDSDTSDDSVSALPPYSEDHPLPKPLKIRTLEGTELECKQSNNHVSDDEDISGDDAWSISATSFKECNGDDKLFIGHEIETKGEKEIPAAGLLST